MEKHYPKTVIGLPSIEFPFADLVPRTAAPPPTHRVADGDTLAGIADRKLGDGSRAGEIFEMNRDVLARPEVLPIGVELKLPRRDLGSSLRSGAGIPPDTPPVDQDGASFSTDRGPRPMVPVVLDGSKGP